ncbi:MAG TPA: DNA polymerase IV [Puia sp.]|nr:DNA polymerase IV [Puia sp.]
MTTEDRCITHLDIDNFIVAVECLKNSNFKNKPLIVGGAGERAIVAVCSQEAEKCGVHSSMPMRLAKRLCPEAIILRADVEGYSRYSREVTEIVAETVPSFEKSSIDGFYIDLSGLERFVGCSALLNDLKIKILDATGLSATFALATNKLICRVAANEVKPDGEIQIPAGGERCFIAPLAVEKLPGLGGRSARILYQMGVEKIRTVSLLPLAGLYRLFGDNGVEIWRRANGIDHSPVVPYREHKSISAERTFDQDTINVGLLQAALTHMAEDVAFHLRQQNKLAGCVAVKLRYTNFETASEKRIIPFTSSDSQLAKTAIELLARLFERRMLVRVLSIRFSQLVPGHRQIDMFSDPHSFVSISEAVDSVKRRFGPQYIRSGRSLFVTKAEHISPRL